MSLDKVYVCPTDKSLQCSWEGSAEDIMDHFILEHEDLLLHSSEVHIDLEVVSENRLLFLNEEIYLIQLKTENNVLKIGLRYLGPQRLANSIFYDIVIKAGGQSYFPDYFTNGPSIFRIVDGFWMINLEYLRLLHEDLTTIQCNFSISAKTEVLGDGFESDDVAREENNQTFEENENEDSANDNTVIEDDEIDAILNEDLELREPKAKSNEEDALDNISALNFSMLENSTRYCRRYSSFMGIPEELFKEKVKTDLSCSNCFINMLPPIYLCVNDHNICAECRYESCKVCYGTVTENRNKDLEEYSRKCLHLCRYHQEGCMESFTYNEIRSHEIRCSFCVYRCMQDCSFKGKFMEFYSHFRIKHPSCKVLFSTPVDFPRNSEFFVCDNRLGIFHCTSMLTKNSVRWIVVFLGPKDRDFSCELTFKGVKRNNVLFLKRMEVGWKYSIVQSKDDLKKMKVKDRNAVLTITGYFQLTM